MKKTGFYFLKMLLLLIFLSTGHTLAAQEILSGEESPAAPEGYEYVDSLVFIHVAGIESTLAGKDIFHIMPLKSRGGSADVEVYQSQAVAKGLREHVASNSKRQADGYRVRIFFDNRQTARAESELTLKRFEAKYHDIKAYRTYVNPYFKVTVGDFRTKSEAMGFLSRIVTEFPSAFVVKESIEFPVVDKDKAYIVDTIRVLRPVTVESETFF